MLSLHSIIVYTTSFCPLYTGTHAAHRLTRQWSIVIIHHILTYTMSQIRVPLILGCHGNLSHTWSMSHGETETPTLMWSDHSYSAFITNCPLQKREQTTFGQQLTNFPTDANCQIILLLLPGIQVWKLPEALPSGNDWGPWPMYSN